MKHETAHYKEAYLIHSDKELFAQKMQDAKAERKKLNKEYEEIKKTFKNMESLYIQMYKQPEIYKSGYKNEEILNTREAHRLDQIRCDSRRDWIKEFYILKTLDV